jgi:hypothetical protein
LAERNDNMKNLDVLQQQKAEIANKMNQAMKDNDEKAFAAAFEEYTNILQEAVLAEAKGLVQAADNTILAGRGVRVLTSEERQYYEKTIEAMKSSTPKQALSGYDNVLPKTVIDAVFEDITESHPLLSEIKFENASALLEYLYSTMNGRFKAVWGKLCSTVTQQLGAQFQKISFGQTKLSAFLPVCKAMLDLGPAWLDRYVRTILFEAIANGLEDGSINGRGVAEGAADPDDYIYEPIGMIRDLTNFNVATGYAAKAAIPVSDFSPESYGGLISQLAVGPNGLNRVITEVLLVVNPVDYLTKIFPATTYKTPQGGYVKDIFPFPTKVVQSAYVTQGKAILGIAKRYLAVLGTGKDGRIEYSDEYKFLEDERYYLIKLYGTGRPLDNTSFLYLDISNIKAVAPIVRVADYVDARLSAITLKNEKNAAVNIGVFDENVHAYYAAITDAEQEGDNDTASLTVSTKDPNATIVVKNGSTTVSPSNGVYSLSLDEGANVITITSTVGATEQEAYILVITYTPIA